MWTVNIIIALKVDGPHMLYILYICKLKSQGFKGVICLHFSSPYKKTLFVWPQLKASRIMILYTVPLVIDFPRYTSNMKTRYYAEYFMCSSIWFSSNISCYIYRGNFDYILNSVQWQYYSILPAHQVTVKNARFEPRTAI